MSSTSFQTPALWIGGAAGSPNSTSLKTTASLGQPAAGAAAATSFKLGAGFAYSAGVLTTASTDVDPNQDKTITLHPPSGRITIEIPAGTFSEAVRVSVRIPATFAEARSNVGSLRGIDIGIEITTDKDLQPQRPVVLTFSFRNSDVQGSRKERLRVAYYVDAEQRWVPLESTVDATNNTIVTRVTHFTVFRIVELVAAANVGAAFVYPNPLRPAKGHTVMNITNLPEDVHIRILTIAGELVTELVTDATGRVAWDGTNGEGEKVASGVYFAFIQRGGEKKTVKLAVER